MSSSGFSPAPSFFCHGCLPCHPSVSITRLLPPPALHPCQPSTAIFFIYIRIYMYIYSLFTDPAHRPASLSQISYTMATVVLVFVALLFFVASALLRWNVLKYRNTCLPPGTMGWPFFGETVEFFKYGPQFIKKQTTRYGSLFKSHVFGCPVVVSTDLELNRYILVSEARGLVPGYPQSMLDILGKSNIAAVHGSTHRNLRGSMLSLVTHLSNKDLLLKVDGFMKNYLSDWDGKTVDIQQKTDEMSFLATLNQIGGMESAAGTDALLAEFFKLVLGTLSLPINLPGTNYRIGIQARKNILNILAEAMGERRASGSFHGDMFDSLLGRPNGQYLLTDEEIIDQIITLLYSGFETVSTTSMMAIKYLHDHPSALQHLREEHMAIRRTKTEDDSLNWSDYKSMRFTRAVILETSRLATVVNGVLRKTTKDIDLKGFLIPKGWRIYVYTREINYDPLLYPEPFTFNPWRWLGKNMENNNYFLLFGGGTRHCPGKELGITEISCFLHYFVTKYRWEEVGGVNIRKFPRVRAQNGLHIKVSSFQDYVSATTT